jgi:hypothetical protein
MIAVVDAGDAENVEGFPDIRRRSLLAGMRGGEESLVTSALEHPGKLARGIAELG